MITNKDKYFQLWDKGLLGNKLRSWRTFGELITDDYRGLLSIRALISDAKIVRYNVPFDQVEKVILEIEQNGVSRDSLIFNESAQDEYLTIQGEVVEAPYWRLWYSVVPGKMRDSLREESKFADGLNAKMIINHFMDEGSINDLKCLLDLYPHHAVEFSTYRIQVGNIPHRNTIIWEVRQY